jgi:hypothetical protein
MCEDILALQDEKVPYKSGFCFLDSTGNGGTAKKILKFCASRNFRKVLYIDPHIIWNKDFGQVVNINPIAYDAPGEAVEGHLMKTLRVLWTTKDPMDEGIIRKYAPKVFRALHAGGYTLPDALCFTIPELANQRSQILSSDRLNFTTRVVLERALAKQAEWRDFQSTCRRLDPFFTDTLKLMFGAKKGIDFYRLISEGWAILVNLYPGGVFGVEHQRLLGTVIINEVVRARERMADRGMSIPYYLYIDEVGQYATSVISDILDYYRHFNIRLTIAHQGMSQIDDSKVLNSIRRSAKNKVLFYTASQGDRRLMCQDMNYGGELPVDNVVYNLGSTSKQEAVIRIGKRSPVLTRLKDWPDPQVSNIELKTFLKDIITSNPDLYRQKDDVDREIQSRFVHSRTTQGHGVSSSGTKRQDSAGNTKKPTGNDGNTTVQAGPLDVQAGPNNQEVGRPGNAPVPSPAEARPKRQAGLVPPKLPKHKQNPK